DDASFSVGSVSSGSSFAGTTGAATGGGDISLNSAINVSLAATTNAGTGTVRLQAGGNVTQTAAGVITAASLGVSTVSGIGLDTAVNVAGNFTATDTTSGAIKLRDNVASLTVGNTVSADAPEFPSAVTGVSGPADITLANSGNVVINQAVTA